MVLQQAPKKATIWGYAAKQGDTITVSISGKGQVNTTSFIGPIPSTPVWSVQLPPIDFLGPYNITATSSEGSINLTDVLFGDVWICSGQSNMQFTLSMVRSVIHWYWIMRLTFSSRTDLLWFVSSKHGIDSNRLHLLPKPKKSDLSDLGTVMNVY